MLVPGLFSLHRMDAWFLILELIVLVAVVISLGAGRAGLAKCVGPVAVSRCDRLGHAASANALPAERLARRA